MPNLADFMSVILGALDYLIGFGLGLAVYGGARELYERIFVDRPTRKFWIPFTKGETTIILSEVPPGDPSMLLGRVGNSLNEALAMADLQDILRHKLKYHAFQIKSCKQEINLDKGNFILIGGPKNNSRTEELFNYWNKTGNPQSYTFSNNDIINGKGSPLAAPGVDEQYAMVISCNNPWSPEHRIAILAGTHAPATEAAAQAVTNHKLLDNIMKNFEDDKQLSAVMKCAVQEGWPRHVEIHTEPLLW